MDEMEAKVNKRVRGETEQLIKKLQLLKTDPAGFGNTYRLKVNGGFLDMDEWVTSVFPKMDVQVNVQTSIVHQGVAQ